MPVRLCDRRGIGVMVRSEIRDLGWVLPSQRLNDTLQRADQIATEQHHRELMLEHVVLGLTDDTDAARVLEANGVDVLRFRDYVARYVAAVDYRWPPEQSALPEPDVALKRIFDVASAAAETSGRNEIDGALLVAAIIGEGTSNAAAMLNQHGLKVDDDEPTQSVEPQTVAETSSNAPDHSGNRTQDLSEIHRMLAAPADPTPVDGPMQATTQGRHAEQQHSGAARMPHHASSVASSPSSSYVPEALPQLQRTRPKVKLPRPTVTAPKAVLSPAVMSAPSAALNGLPTSTATSSMASGARVAPAIAPPVRPAASMPNPAPPPSVSGQNEPAPVHKPDEDEYEASVDGRTPAPVEGFAQIDVNILGDILPAKMCVGVPEIVEIRVLNSDIDLLTGQFEGRDVAQGSAKLVSRSLSLRLRSPSALLSVEARSPEVQWIDVNDTVVGDEATSWRWQLTGQKRGEARLQLLASARTVASDGTVLETAMPEQSASVRIKRGFGAALKRLVFVFGLFLAGCVIGLVARPAYRMIEGFLFG